MPRFDFRVSTGACSETGTVRANNEDVVLVEPQLGLFAVADGMGGAAAGEVAADLAAKAFRDVMKEKSTQRAFDRFLAAPTVAMRHRVFAALHGAAKAANQAVRSAAGSQPDWTGMGSTLTAVSLLRDRAFVAHIGDSRAYLLRPSAALQLTHDHTLLDQLRETHPTGRLAYAPARNPLVNAVGLGEDQRCDTLFVELARGDRLVLCTDGVHGAFRTEAGLGETARKGTAEIAARALVEEALARGSRDNCSAVVLEIGERFVTRPGDGHGQRDFSTACLAPLFVDVPPAMVLRVLSVAVELDLAAGSPMPQTIANDRVSYVVLDGEIRSADGRVFAGGAMLYPESLVDEPTRGGLFTTVASTRVLRLRGDDFRETCEADRALAATLYARLARHLARAR